MSRCCEVPALRLASYKSPCPFVLPTFTATAGVLPVDQTPTS